LYFFYNKLFKKINQENNSEDNYYLVNKESMNIIKKDYNYNVLKTLLKDSGINEDNKLKKILNIIKNQEDNFVKSLFRKDNLNNKYKKEYMESYISPLYFKINGQKTSIIIFDNFEIVSKDIFELFVGKINEKKGDYLKCTLQENKILICYPKIYKNQFYISIIGTLNSEATFINEYVLIYKKSPSQSYHKKKISYSIVNYINEVEMNMFNNSVPITDDNYKEIGLLIKYENNLKNENNTYEFIMA